MRRFFLALLLTFPICAQVRVDPFPASTVKVQAGPGAQSPILAVPFALITICNYPGNGNPCTNFAQTYSSATLATPCPLTTPVTQPNSNQCSNHADAQGRFGFWLKAGTYVYTVTGDGAHYGPYTFTAGGSGGLNFSFQAPLTTAGTIVGLPTTGTYPKVVTAAQPGTPGNFASWDQYGNAVDSGTNASALEQVIASTYAPIASPTFTGTVTAPTANITSLTVGSCSGCSAGSGIAFQTNGQNNGSQSLLNIVGANGNTAANSGGTVTITAPNPPVFQAQGINLTDQSGINIAAGSNVSVAAQGKTVFIATTGGSGGSNTIPYTVATLPAPASLAGKTVLVSDGNTSTDCTAGHGTYVVACTPNTAKTAWINAPIGQSGTLSGSASGVLTGTYPSPAFRDWYSASDYSSVQAACTAAGTTGLVVIPWNYAGTDTTWSCGNTQVLDQRNTSYTKYDARANGLRGDGKVITDGFITGGTAVLGSASQYCFVAGDVGKHIKVLDGNSTGAVSVLPTNSIVGSIVSVASCQATLSVASTGTGNLTGLKVFFATDDSAAFQALATMIGQKALGAAKIEFGGGVFAIKGPIYITSSILIAGAGDNATSLRQIDPTQDLLIWKPPNGAVGQTAGVAPNAFPMEGGLYDINLQGEGTNTTGNLLVIAVSSLPMRAVSFTGHGGIAILQSQERTHMADIFTRNVNRALVTSMNFPANESYLGKFDFMDSGLIADSLLSNGFVYSTNVNAVNGIYPGMTAAAVPDGTPGPYSITEEHHTAITLNGITNYEIEDGSIKSTRALGGVSVSESNGQVEIRHVYTENGTFSGYAAVDVVAGGPPEGSVTTQAIGASDTTVLIQDGRWMANFVGKATDTNLLAYGGACSTQAFLYPPDFVYGSSAPSILGGAITQGTYELVNNCNGWHDAAGWHAGIGRKAGSIAWPAGALYEQLPVLPGGGIVLADCHLHSLSYDTGTRYTLTENPNLGQIQGSVIVGFVPSLLHAWATPLALNNYSRSVMFKGDIAESPQWSDNNAGGTVEIQENGNVDTHDVWSGIGGLASAKPIQAGGLGQLLYPMPEIGARMIRANYGTGNPPNASYSSATTSIGFSYANANIAGYSFVPVLTGSNGPMFQFSSRYQIWDSMYGSTSNPNDIWQFQSDTTNLPGLYYKIYNPTPDNYTTTFTLQGSTQAEIAAGSAAEAQLSLNYGGSVTQTGAVMNNSLQLYDIDNAAAPTVTATGGTTQYCYEIVAYQADGSHTAGINAGCTTTGPASLSSGSPAGIAWNAPGGSPAYYNVFRTTGGGTLGQINTAPILATATRSFTDTGLSASGTAPTANNSGGLLLGSRSTTALPAGKLEADGDQQNVLIRGDGTLALVPTGTQPSCTSSERGSFWYINAPAGTADSVQTCSKNASNTYAWTTIGTGGSGGGAGGSNNSIQYNSGGVLSGILNSSSVLQFVTQQNGQAPALQALSTSMLPTGIPLANLATIGANTLLGNNTSGSAVPAPLSVANLNALLSVAPGSASTFGVVEVDGTTITAAGGVLSAAPQSFSQLASGTNATSLTVGSGGMFGPSGTGVVNANQLNGAAVPISLGCAGTDSNGHLIACSGGGGGGVSSVSINGGTAQTGAVALTLPNPTAPPASGMSIVSSGGNINLIATAPVDMQAFSNGGYTVPAADCTANVGLLIITGTGTGSMPIGISQAGLSQNFVAGCKLSVINESNASVVISFTTSTWNTISGTNAITLAARSSGTAHTAWIASDGSDYKGWQN